MGAYMSTVLLNLRKGKFLLFFLDLAIIFRGLLFFTPVSSFFVALLTGISLTALYSFRCFDFTDHTGPSSMAAACVGALLLSLFGSFFLSYFFNEPLGGRAIVLTFLFFLLLFPLLHSVFLLLLLRFLPAEHLLILGNTHWEPLFREIAEVTRGKICAAAFVPPHGESLDEGLRLHPFVSGLVLTEPGFPENPPLAGVLEDLMKRGFQVKYLCETAEFSLRRIPLSVLQSFGPYYDITLRTRSPRAYSRAMDILLSLFLLLLFSPVMLIMAVSIALSTGFPVLYSQPRTGRNGSVFTLRKFRTMTPSDEDAASFAGDNLHRITPVGRFFRKTRLDELPQLWNVLKGDMSLIGPRPEQVEFDRRYEREIPFYSLRSRLRPGITGWAQINDAYASNREETIRKLEYDLFYVKNASPLLDLEIVLKTGQIMLGMRGSK